MVSYRNILVKNNFGYFLLANWISILGDSIHQVALLLLLLHVTSSATSVSYVFLAFGIPPILFGPIAGLIADRWNRKFIMIPLDLIRAMLVLLIPLFFLNNLPGLYIITLLLSALRALYSPSQTALKMDLAGKTNLLQANALSGTGTQVQRILGPVLGTFIIALLSIKSAFFVDAGTFLFSVVMISLIPTVESPAVQNTPLAVRSIPGRWQHFVSELLQGYRAIRQNRSLLLLVLFSVAAFSWGSMLNVLIPVVIKLRLGANDQQYGLLMSLFTLGFLGGNFIAPYLKQRWSVMPLLGASLVVDGIAVCGLGIVHDVGTAAGVLILQGISNALFIIFISTEIQLLTEAKTRGRVLSSQATLVQLAVLLPNALTGPLVDAWGHIELILIVNGISQIALVLFFLYVFMRFQVKQAQQIHEVERTEE